MRATAYLRFSATCQAAWAKVVFNKPLTYPHGGLAIIKRNDGKSYDCADAGGNGLVAVTQTSCYSAMVGDASGYSARASAQYYINETFQTVATTASY
ncbi:hypothetical protein KSD_69940 [Ktedonobacter sp. SOSP1-85]|nr:hypothetical protein KSD_69940 [Ktedonobacter sp. SOSP1-85]